MTTATLPSGTDIVSTYTYDDADRLTEIEHVKGGSTTLASVAYTLDEVGNRTQRVDQQGTHTYVYDDLHRLTSVTYPGPSTTTYDFDAFGNRTEMTVGSDTTTYDYDDADRLTAVTPPSPASPISYTWDDNGNLTDRGSDSFSWDYEDRMVEATVNSVTTTFAYRGDGLRDSRTVGMTTTTFTWDIAWGFPVVLDDGNQYVYGAGLASMKQSGNWYYYLADGLGSTMAVVDSSGNSQKSYQYDVYGEVTGGSGSLSNEFDFAGQQTDDTGLQYLRARYYDPATGTFLSREPLSLVPQTAMQGYGFALGTPTGMTDLDGLCPRFTPKSACKAGSWAKDTAGDAGGAAVSGAKSAAAGAASAGASVAQAVVHPLSGDPLNNLLTTIQFLDTLPLGAACVGVAMVNAGAGMACKAIDVAIGLAAFYASMIQAGMNQCSAGRNGTYIGLAAASAFADLYSPAGGKAAVLLKEGVESVVDGSILAGQTALTSPCSATPTVFAGEKSR
jgi:RHS repeat-associated protein